MGNEYFEFLDTKRNTIFHVPILEVSNKDFLEDVSLKMKIVTRDMIRITEYSSEALDKINNSGYLYKDFANEMFIHVHKVELVDKLPEIQIQVTPRGIEALGDVIVWDKLDL
jgi:hypothetical protein